jgi:hypothetical protein
VFPPKTLGFDAPIAPNGEVLDAARELKPELAKAEVDVCDFSLRPLPNIGLGEGADDLLDVSESADVVVDVPVGSLVVMSWARGGQYAYSIKKGKVYLCFCCFLCNFQWILRRVTMSLLLGAFSI